MKRVSSTASENIDFIETSDGKKDYNVSRSRVMGLINWAHVFKLYLPVVFGLIVAVVAIQITSKLHFHGFDLNAFWSKEVIVLELEKPDLFSLGWKGSIIIAILVWVVHSWERTVYLLDFTTFEPPKSWRITSDSLMEILHKQEPPFSEESLKFTEKILAQSGVGDGTAWPPSILNFNFKNLAMDETLEAARRESETVIFDCVRKLLKRTKTKAKDVDFLIINCSLFSPTPSLCSMVINEFGMRSDVGSYNLSGMGCSAGVISLELAKNLLAGRPNSKAMIVSTENLTQALYHGNERAFLLQNTLFRCGGAAVMLSNSWMDSFRSQMKLLTVMRTQYVAADSYDCVYETEDSNGNKGVRLSKDIVKVAGRALELNFTNIGPLILPISEQIPVVISMIKRAVYKRLGWGKVTPYIPDFKRGIDHFCIHAGGRGVIDGIEKNLKLAPEHVAASRHALLVYGNTSSSSIWYEMNYLRNFGNLKVGQRVLQIAFGSGFKCNSAVWLCINNGSRPGKRNHIDDRELEAEELEKQLDEFGYIKRQTNYSASTSRCGNFPRLEDKKLK